MLLLSMGSRANSGTRPKRGGAVVSGVNPMIIDKDRKIAEELKRQLLTHDGERIRRVILYGSRAQGRATEDSDFDLLVG